MTNIEYERLNSLRELIKSNKATAPERKEYMKLMYDNGHITEKQYNNYLSENNSDDIIKATLVLGGSILIAWLLTKIFD